MTDGSFGGLAAMAAILLVACVWATVMVRWWLDGSCAACNRRQRRSRAACLECGSPATR